MANPKIMNYFKKVLAWVWEGKYLFLFLILIIIAFRLDRINIGLKTVDNIRIYGLLLQLMGAISIIYSLKEKLLLFRGIGYKHFIFQYFKSFPLRAVKKNIRVYPGTGGLSFAGAEARGIIKPREELKDIIRYFEEEIQYLHNRIANNKSEFKSDLRKVEDTIETLNNNFKQGIKETRTMISDSSVSNIWLDTFGVLSVIVGLILSTIPDFIENIL